MPIATRLLLGAVCLLAACSPKAPQTATADGKPLTVKEVMRTHIEPNAQIFWHSSGYVDTAAGSENLMPKTPEGWKAAEDSVDAVIEGALLLKSRELSRDRRDWIKNADALIAQAKLAKAATKARDGDQMFLTGGDMYSACTACHKQYLLPLLGPDGRPKKIDENGSPIVTAPK
jgi:hypothetical protein